MKQFFLGALLFFIFCPFSAASEKGGQPHDFYVLLSNLLKVNEDRFELIDDRGVARKDDLKLFKELERVYMKYIEPDLPDRAFSKDRLKVVMFFSFYAEQHRSAAFQEYLASDLMPIYAGNRDVFLEILGELPFLIPSNCDRLDAYFGFEGKNASMKSDFIDENIDLFGNYLNGHQKTLCLKEFKDKKPHCNP